MGLCPLLFFLAATFHGPFLLALLAHGPFLLALLVHGPFLLAPFCWPFYLMTLFSVFAFGPFFGWPFFLGPFTKMALLFWPFYDTFLALL